ncbi:MAG: hypothetical protein RL428_165 [Actinomycetota bacterium]
MVELRFKIAPVHTGELEPMNGAGGNALTTILTVEIADTQLFFVTVTEYVPAFAN